MYRWSSIPDEFKPAIISDVSDNKLYTILTDKTRKLYTPSVSRHPVIHSVEHGKIARFISRRSTKYKSIIFAIDHAWEGSSRNQTFKNIIENNTPCVITHKVKNEWIPVIDTIVCFMTGDAYDVFLVHPKDLMEWNSSEET